MSRFFWFANTLFHLSCNSPARLKMEFNSEGSQRGFTNVPPDAPRYYVAYSLLRVRLLFDTVPAKEKESGMIDSYLPACGIFLSFR